MGKLKQKHIEQFLQDIEDFQFGEKSKMQLEQHMTPPVLAAQLLFHIYNNHPVQDLSVADLGIGTGMLTCGLVYLGFSMVVGVELDSKYVRVAQEQLEEKVEGGPFDLIEADIRHLNLRPKSVDMVVMNPPFGTKQEGIDCVFLEKAMEVARGDIYSMHKSSTRDYLCRFATQRGYRFEVIMEYKFPLKKRFNKYHRKEVAYAEVDVIRLTPGHAHNKKEEKQQEKVEKAPQKKQEAKQESNPPQQPSSSE